MKRPRRKSSRLNRTVARLRPTIEPLETRLALSANMLQDVNSGVPAGSVPEHLTVVNGLLFFSASDGVHGNELWKSDGTQAGTVMVKDIEAGSSGSYPKNLTAINGTLFFSATDD